MAMLFVYYIYNLIKQPVINFSKNLPFSTILLHYLIFLPSIFLFSIENEKRMTIYLEYIFLTILYLTNKKINNSLYRYSNFSFNSL